MLIALQQGGGLSIYRGKIIMISCIVSENTSVKAILQNSVRCIWSLTRFLFFSFFLPCVRTIYNPFPTNRLARIFSRCVGRESCRARTLNSSLAENKPCLVPLTPFSEPQLPFIVCLSVCQVLPPFCPVILRLAFYLTFVWVFNISK